MFFENYFSFQLLKHIYTYTPKFPDNLIHPSYFLLMSTLWYFFCECLFFRSGFWNIIWWLTMEKWATYLE